ncbi:MAG: hypothetical protein ABGY96_02990 [bacterium]|nr:hypothetical protein [Pseudomonadales bacterium]
MVVERDIQSVEDLQQARDALNGPFENRRYKIYTEVAPHLLETLIAVGTIDPDTGFLSMNLQIHDVIPDDDIGLLLVLKDLKNTKAYTEYYREQGELPVEDLGFNDAEQLNSILDCFVDRLDAISQILALRDSFVGFLMLLKWYVDQNDAIESMLARLSSPEEKSTYVCKEITRQKIDVLPEDVQDAITFVIGCVETSLIDDFDSSMSLLEEAGDSELGDWFEEDSKDEQFYTSPTRNRTSGIGTLGSFFLGLVAGVICAVVGFAIILALFRTF